MSQEYCHNRLALLLKNKMPYKTAIQFNACELFDVCARSRKIRIPITN